MLFLGFYGPLFFGVGKFQSQIQAYELQKNGVKYECLLFFLCLLFLSHYSKHVGLILF